MRPSPPRQSAPEPDPYATIAELYDLEHADYDEDITLYLNLAEVIGDPILEFACGTGRIMLPLAKAGWRVTGLDRSRSMLAVAREAIAAEGLERTAQVVESNLTDAARAPGGPFGLVILGLNGLMHLPTLARQRACLAAARRALDPRGQLVVDTLNPTADVLRSFDHGVVHEGRWTQADGTVVDKFGSRALAHSTQTIETRIWYDTVDAEARIHRTTSEFTLRYVHRAELELMLELAGFIECQFYGSYDLDPFEDDSERLIVTAEVSPSTPAPLG